ncbi:DEAD/DEAH box helicase [Burkholderia gladioli]|uniref:DEAD/DEAH box helicase n=1 Tax=Burkholderia gladioli TaxID=28095 RepID=UPI00264C472D|nr:DEAD/DEAH box helicase [Burkholderia gladioli]MDN7726281.1 DEAD/DEAH box helicase [Burkholderia gladioli]
MSLDFARLYESGDLLEIHSEIDSTLLSKRVNRTEKAADGVSKLSVAANLATSVFFDDLSLDELSREGSAAADTLEWCVSHWRAFLEAIENNGSDRASLDDLLFFAATGILNKQQAEVRTALRAAFAREIVDRAYQKLKAKKDWRDVCKAHISCAVLFLVRQSNHADLRLARSAIDDLIALQQKHRSEIEMLAAEATKSGLLVLGLYHVAHATTRTALYLTAGRVEGEDGRSTNFEPELRRLLGKAEELIEASGSTEHLIWVRAVGAALWKIFDDSVWRQAIGLSSTIDGLVSELARRDHPIFSLLPSQQEALQEHLLDSAQVAVVLQMPTSAGKTLLAEFAILQAFEAYKDSTRVVYIAPTRALCTQTYRTLASDLSGLGIQVQLASSAFEEDPFESSLISEIKSGVVVSTPEKIDLLLRAQPEWFNSVKLVVVDEAHLLSDNERGVRLELLLANLRREQSTVRFLLLTPFVDNADQVAKWLGGSRGAPINIRWRPARLMIGLASSSRKSKRLNFSIEWKEPHARRSNPKPLHITIDENVPSSTAIDRVVALHSRFSRLGLTLGMFPASRAQAEEAAVRIATSSPIDKTDASAEKQFAIALAEAEYGDDCALAYCLKRGVAFHHAALSPELRYLVEELGRSRQLKFLAATTTLAQGINFPVATVLVHSIHKPFGNGDLTPSEFWNIAGRAGRVGLADKGFIVFASGNHREKWEKYTRHLSESIVSALLDVLVSAINEPSLKKAYRKYPQIRPFLQYLAHAAANLTVRGALTSLEEILEASFANSIASGREERRALRDLAARYLGEIANKPPAYLKIADTTGFSSFSFDELYAQIPGDSVLSAGPQEVLRGGADSLAHLVSALAWLPELDLALGKGNGPMDVAAVARVIEGWIGGKTVREIAPEFGGGEVDQLRNAGTYLFTKVSQTISWGAHAYIRGWNLGGKEKADEQSMDALMLPAYIQHGVNTPEAAVASLFSVPRLMAEPLATCFRANEGRLSPDNVRRFRTFIEQADEKTWGEALKNSKLAGKVAPAQARAVWRRMRGLDGPNR